jgi:UDP-2,3-diacylglucosamine pyrophosphatase LpxH
VLYILGNHDHSVVHPDLQSRIRHRILKGQKNQPALSDKIEFPNFYKDDDLQVYAEHGNQFTYGGAYKYQNFDQFGEECPGYFELKLVQNRVERDYPELDNVTLSPSQWPGLFWWVLFRWPWAWSKFRRCYHQYKNDTRSEVEEARKGMPSPMCTVGNFLWNKYFSVTKDEFSDAVEKLFKSNGTTKPLWGQSLDQNYTKTIILGHSHDAREVDLPGHKGVRYYNTGSWIFRYEKGRCSVEQIWVTISRDLPSSQDESSQGPLASRIIDRKMFRRRVEMPQEESAPVTTNGYPLNSVMREIQDLRVGDVVLLRWNISETIKRRFKPWKPWTVIKLIGDIPAMVISWLNRYGTSSYWSHAALVYATPYEKQESADINDPLFLEALPNTGVGIHGPNHYLSHKKEWDLGFLRPKFEKASWLHDEVLLSVTRTFFVWNKKEDLNGLQLTEKPSVTHTFSVRMKKEDLKRLRLTDQPSGLTISKVQCASADLGELKEEDHITQVDQTVIKNEEEFKKALDSKDGWRNRRLLRRVALSTLDSQYASQQISHQILDFASRLLDQQKIGKLLVAGLFRGALFGIFTLPVLAVWIMYLQARSLGEFTIVVEDMSGNTGDWFYGLKEKYFLSNQVFEVFQNSDWLLLAIYAVIALILLFIGFIAIWGLLRIAAWTWLRATAGIGAVWGVLIVPIMAELSQGWTEKSDSWRWAATLLWMSIAVIPVVLFTGGWISTGHEIRVCIFVTATVMVFFSELLTNILAPGLVRIVVCWTELKQKIQKLLRILGIEANEEYMCSGLVQYALASTADEVFKGQKTQVANVVVHPDFNPGESFETQKPLLKETIHRHFAEATPPHHPKHDDKFDWTYLYLNGVVLPKPSPSHTAEVEPEPLRMLRKEMSNKEAPLLSPDAKLSLCLALVGLLCTVFYEGSPSRWEGRIAWDMLPLETWPRTFVWVLPGIAVGLGFGAIELARRAWDSLTLDPGMPGQALRLGGLVLGWAGVVRALVLAWPDPVLSPVILVVIGIYLLRRFILFFAE